MKKFLGLLPRKLRRTIHKHYVDAEGCTYRHDGFITFRNADFLNEPLFQEAYRLGQATGSWGSAKVEWRAYVVCWAAAHGRRLEGDFVECGVNRGGYSRAVMHYIGFQELPDRKFYLLDTFRGFPEEMRALAAPGHEQSYRECYQDVVNTFRQFENAVIIRGKIPETLPLVPAEKVCFLSIDLNCAEPEIAAAEHFWDRLVSGAVVVLDDYGGGPAYLRQKHAFDDFARRRNVPLLPLPTGQGLFLKP